MKADRYFKDHYAKKIHEIQTPPPPPRDGQNTRQNGRELFAQIAVAALLVAAVIPALNRLEQPSVLELRASEFSKTYQIGSAINSGFAELHNFSPFKSISGGIK